MAQYPYVILLYRYIFMVHIHKSNTHPPTCLLYTMNIIIHVYNYKVLLLTFIPYKLYQLYYCSSSFSLCIPPSIHPFVPPLSFPHSLPLPYLISQSLHPFSRFLSHRTMPYGECWCSFGRDTLYQYYLLCRIGSDVDN